MGSESVLQIRHKQQIGLLCALLLGFWLSMLGHQTVAAALPAKPQYNFYDETQTLTTKTEKLVSDRNLYYDQTKAKPQVMVAVIKSTDGDSIDSYAPDLFQKWGIGQAGKDNGILILYAMNQGARNVRIEVGYGLESVITDSISGRILQKYKTQLKSSDPAKVNQGLQQTFNSVVSLIDAHYGYKGNKYNLSAEEVAELKQGQRHSDKRWVKWIGLVVTILVIAWILGNSGGGGSGPGSRRRDHGDALPWWLWLGSSSGSGGSSWGGGSGGGFGGFSGGGGSSGGGGASI